jgi:hypothetical protein
MFNEVVELKILCLKKEKTFLGCTLRLFEKENVGCIGSSKSFSAPVLTIIPNDSIPDMAAIPEKDGTSIISATIDGIVVIIAPTVENVMEQIHGIPKELQHNKLEPIMENI